ncbi:MAG: TIGR02117 family protein [Candidatus Obscuribacterales bacterium]|nr:TIGR02117 family protein [Steroidobacteraceae bacterium]
MFKRLYGWLLAIATTAVVIVALAMGGCAVFKDWTQLPKSHDDERHLFVVSHGWHTGIVVARRDLGAELDFIPQQLGESAFYEFGWGNKAFYQAKDETIWIMLKAVWPSASTMHVVAVQSDPTLEFPNSEVVPLHVSALGQQRLVAGIAAAFAKNEAGSVQSTRAGLYGHSRFFEANGNFYLTNTCNTWTAKMLSLAGVPTTKVLTLTAGSVIRQSKLAAKKYQCCAF